MTLRLLSHAEQVAAHLRTGIMGGRWLERMPGEARLREELGVNHTTIGAALRLLEQEGLLVPQGAGRRRQIVLPVDAAPPGLRVGLLLYEPADHHAYDVVELRHRLMEAGHAVQAAAKTLTELAMDVRRVARMVQRIAADAWVILSASEEVLEWFAKQPIPAIANAGQYPPNMPLASVGPGMKNALAALVRRLVSLGHRRIVLLTSSGAKPASFVEEMEAHGLPVGPYNTPVWDYGPDGFRRRLDSLFAHTPPTALIIDEAPLFHAAQHHLARCGIFAPEHISLICTDPDPVFEWYKPTVAHLRWDKDPVVRRIVRWVANVSRGRDDRRQTRIDTKFVDGGTVGPVPGKKQQRLR